MYAVTLTLFLLSKGVLRRRVVLAASYFFYAADSVPYLALLVFVTLTSYYGGRIVSRRRSRVALLLSTAVTAAPLALFKLADLAGWHIPLLSPQGELALISAIPIGISFYTLQALSYIVDAYRRTGPLSPDVETHALYLAFFPQLLAGPIERGARLVPQVSDLRSPSSSDIFVGAKAILWGYFCKLVIADNIAGIVDRILTSYDRVPAATLPVALYLYSFQIYFDFLGYSMIAIGLGRTFGVSLSVNFDRPYLARSIREFWGRWHITLSSWLRDYIYRPIGGRRNGRARFVLAIIVTFLISGLWHGASINFLLWGALHAVLFLIAAATVTPRNRLFAALPDISGFTWARAAVSVLFCFSLVSFTWLFFRVEDLADIRQILSRMAEWVYAGAPLQLAPMFSHPDTVVFLALLVVAFTLDATGTIQRVIATVPRGRMELSRELALVNIMAVALFLFGDLGNRAFIYFRF